MFDDRTTEGTHSAHDRADRKPLNRDLPFAMTPAHSTAQRHERLADLTALSVLPIEIVSGKDLSDTLHDVFDHVSDTTLPIYFGPLLGRLYLEGL